MKAEIDGTMSLVPVCWDTWNETRKEFRDRHGVRLPERAQLQVIGRPEQLWLLDEEVTVTVTRDNSQWFQWQFLPGYIFDGGSIPRFARWLFLPTNPAGIHAWAVHDANYSFHFVPRKTADKIMRDMILQQEAPPGAWPSAKGIARISYLAVRGFGRRRWKNGKTRGAMIADTVRFTKGR